MRFLLTTLNAKYIHSNLAIRLLYELNHKRGDVDMREFTIKEPREKVAEACAAYEVVAFSCYIWNITQTLEAARTIKALNPAVKILLGGPEVSYDWQEIITLPEVDFIITGEGEIPFTAFLKQWPEVGGIPNLVYKNAAGEVQYFPETQIFELSNYRDSLPYQFDAPEALANKILYLETSRGCPYKCEFCLASLDNKVRYLPMENIKANLLFMMQHGRVIKFLDRTFNVKKDFTLEIFRFILENHQPGNIFQFEITADILHPDIVQFIHDEVPPGLFRFEIGIQTLNQKANLEVSRKQNFDKTRRIIEALQHKIEMHLDLIVGLPLDRWEDIRYSFEEVFKLFPPELQLGFLKFLKGTPVRYKHEQHGFVFDPNPPYQIIESNYLSREELRRIELLEHALEIYWNKKRSPNLLRYAQWQYGAFDFLTALGVYFEQQSALIHYTLEDVYRIAADFLKTNYPDDKIALELLAIDYCENQRRKSSPPFFAELEGSARNWLLSDLKETGTYRYTALPLSFDFDTFEQEGVIFPAETVVVFRYDGKSAAQRLSAGAPKSKAEA